MPEPVLAVADIRKSFAGVDALRGVSLTIQPGEVYSLVGENGSGKSTLIKVIAGVHEPDAGRIYINGREYERVHPITAIREGIHVIYQDFSLFPNLTVAENIALPQELVTRTRWVRWKRVKEIARRAIERIGIDIDLDAPVEILSVADKQLVAICRALVHNARLIIMDEPTTALTEREIRSLFSVVQGLKARGISILFVSHKLNEVLEISDKVAVIRNGIKVADGPVEDFDWRKLVFHMTGRSVASDRYPTPLRSSGQPLLELRNLGCEGRFSDISFRLYPGEILGVTGLLGSGRTDLALALFGLRPADRGTVVINGRTVTIRSVKDALKNGIGYVPEDRLTQGLFMTQSIGWNILAGIVHRLTGRNRLIDSSRARGTIENWLRDLQIATPSADNPVNTLSGGNQQRVVLAKWLAQDPQILILNGPTVGVDVGSKEEIHRIIQRLAAKGMGVLIMSDDIPELIHNCHRILLMREGRMVEELPAGSVTEPQLAAKLTGA